MPTKTLGLHSVKVIENFCSAQKNINRQNYMEINKQNKHRHINLSVFNVGLITKVICCYHCAVHVQQCNSANVDSSLYLHVHVHLYRSIFSAPSLSN